LTQYSDIIFSTFSPKGNKVILFFVLPTNKTVDVYCTFPIQFCDIEGILLKMSQLLQVTFGKSFTIIERLHLKKKFHPDPLFMALFLAYQLHRRGKYLTATQHNIMQLKLSLISNFLPSHDRHLGQLEVSAVTTKSHPFYVELKDDDNRYTLLRRKGWFVMDVDGNGHCGYYSIFLGLENIGIQEFYIDTTQDTVRQRKQRWDEQVIKLRTRLKETSELLLREVYPVGSKGRELNWWIESIGVVLDEEKDALSDSFLHTNHGDDDFDVSFYFSSVFREPANFQYHMNPYWTALVLAYLYSIRVVVYTRTSTPLDNGDIDYVYSVKVFEFGPDFAQNKDTYNPVTELRGCRRIKDSQFSQRKTIELVFLTGFKDKLGNDDSADDQHFMFLRRMYTDNTNTRANLSDVQLGLFLKQKLKSAPNAVEAEDEPNQVEAHSGHSNTETQNEPVPMEIDTTQNVTATTTITEVRQLPPEQQPSPTNASPTTNTNTAINHPPATPVIPTNSTRGKQFSPTSQKKMPAVKKKQKKQLPSEYPPPAPNNSLLTDQDMEVVDQPRTEQQILVTATRGKQLRPNQKKLPPVKKKQSSKQSTTQNSKTMKKSNTTAVIIRTRSEKIIDESTSGRGTNEENHDDDSNNDHFDYMYDQKTGCFYKATFNSVLKRYLNKVRVQDISEIDAATIEDAKQKPNEWVTPPLGDPWDDPPPVALLTDVKTLYEQLGNPYCLTYCMASAIFYCGFTSQAKILCEAAKVLSTLNMNKQLNGLRGLMEHLVPAIGVPTIYGKRTQRKTKRIITWNVLFTDITPYPTLVIPALPNGKMSHAICIVDDLIFDSGATHALKLKKESIDWIFGGQDVNIFVALRFNKKYSPPNGQKTRWTYKREVCYHWQQDTYPTVSVPPVVLDNKTYDIDFANGENDGDAWFVNVFTGMSLLTFSR